MRVKELSKCQFIVTLSPSENLIVEGYANLFGTSMQSAALVMCVHGWNSYAELMMQYNRNCRVTPTGPESSKLVENHNRLIACSDEALNFRKAMKEVSDAMLGVDSG